MTQHNSLHWFRQDLRLTDNPAFTAAVASGAVLPIYIVDTTCPNAEAMGEASFIWLMQSLQALNKQLHGKLLVLKGSPSEIIPALVHDNKIESVFWNRCYTPWQIKRDTKLKSDLCDQGVTVKTFNSALLWEPWQVVKGDGNPYKIFTPYYRTCLKASPPRLPIVKPKNVNLLDVDKPSLKKWLYAIDSVISPKWAQSMMAHWCCGETGAMQRCLDFLSEDVMHYTKARDMPSCDGISKLSPHLHFGEISPNQIWYKLKQQEESDDSVAFSRQLVWREFSYSLLYHYPTLPHQNFKSQFDHFPWQNNPRYLKQWQQGLTGYPIIDAGMRELWQTGFMHNRVRMITASFLIKNGMVDWRLGAAWFWDCLVDADLANNSAGWQWVAGSGTDCSPFFRIFNPVTQGKKFDAEAAYIRRYVPELANLPNKYIHTPWEAPTEILKQAGIDLGTTYPQPIVDLKTTRACALDAYRQIK